MKLTLANPAARESLYTKIMAVLGATARPLDNVAKLRFYLPDVAANAGNTVVWGGAGLVKSTGVDQTGEILPGQLINVYDFETNQGSIHNIFLEGGANSMVLDVDPIVV